MFMIVASYRYLLPTMDLLMTDIANGWLSDLDLSRHHPLLWGAMPALKGFRMAGFPKNDKSGGKCRHKSHIGLPAHCDSSIACRMCLMASITAPLSYLPIRELTSSFSVIYGWSSSRAVRNAVSSSYGLNSRDTSEHSLSM